MLELVVSYLVMHARALFTTSEAIAVRGAPAVHANVNPFRNVLLKSHSECG